MRRSIRVEAEGPAVREVVVAHAGRVPVGMHAIEPMLGDGVFIVAYDHALAEVTLRVIPRQSDEDEDPDRVISSAIERVNKVTRSAHGRGLCQRADQLRVEVIAA